MRGTRHAVPALVVAIVACSSSTDTTVSPLVAQCQAAANNFATLCAGSAPRPCFWTAYAKLCATGNTQLLVDSMKCLDNTTCRTFSDPNQGAACLAMVHTNGETDAAKTAVKVDCMQCQAPSCDTVTGTAEILPYLPDSDLSALPGCEGTTCDILAIPASCPSIPELAPFATCK